MEAIQGLTKAKTTIGGSPQTGKIPKPFIDHQNTVQELSSPKKTVIKAVI